MKNVFLILFCFLVVIIHSNVVFADSARLVNADGIKYTVISTDYEFNMTDSRCAIFVQRAKIKIEKREYFKYSNGELVEHWFDKEEEFIGCEDLT